jgi:LacI family transcriptional regulator
MNGETSNAHFHIGLDVPLNQGHFMEIFNGAVDYASTHPSLTLSNFYGKTGQVRSKSDLGHLDGLILATASNHIIRKLTRFGKKAVVVSCRHAQPLTSEVVPDNRLCGIQAAEFLLARRFAHLAYLGFSDFRYSHERLQGFTERLRQEGLKPHILSIPVRVRPGKTYPQIMAALKTWIRDLPSGCGLYACSDTLAARAIHAALTQGMLVPGELAVLGTDNDVMPFTFHPMPIASIPLRSRRIGWLAAERLHQLLLGNRPQPRSILVPPGEVIVRQSVDTLGIDNPSLARALSFMQARYAEKLDITVIAKNAGCSRRHLEIQFQKILHSTPLLELRKIRMRQAQHLLETTDWTMERVAAACGILDAGKFIRYFREYHGTTPGRLRTRTP